MTDDDMALGVGLALLRAVRWHLQWIRPESRRFHLVEAGKTQTVCGQQVPRQKFSMVVEEVEQKWATCKTCLRKAGMSEDAKS